MLQIRGLGFQTVEDGPSSVASIGTNAFDSCTNLTSVTIGPNVTNIGDSAFYCCESLTNVTIGNGVTNIGDDAFEYCNSLTSVTIGTNVSSIGNGAFTYCSSLTSVTIPNSITSIGDYAFEGTSLTNVTIGTNVISIGDSAFYDCISLTSVSIGNSVTNIGDSAFFGCMNLSSVYFQGNAPSFGLDVFVYLVWGTGILQPPISVWDPATIYYLAGTSGWSTNFAGLPTALGTPQVRISDATFGVRTNRFGFTRVPQVCGKMLESGFESATKQR